ncbi:transcriptional regulator of acetoin/glycerol metabolism [Ensifer sp. 4252]
MVLQLRGRKVTARPPPLDMKKVDAAMKLVGAGTSPVEAAKQLNLGRSTIYREMRRLGVSRSSGVGTT